MTRLAIRFCIPLTLIACNTVLPGNDSDNIIDGEVGLSHFIIENGTDMDLAVTYGDGAIATPTVIATEVLAGETTKVLQSSGCFGCLDYPADALAHLTLTDIATDTEAFVFNPVENSQWNEEVIADYQSDFVLVLALPAE